MSNIVELAPQDFKVGKAPGPHLVTNTVELDSLSLARIEDHKFFANEENLVERLATGATSQDWPYLALGHSSLAVVAFTHGYIGDSDLKVDLA